MQSKSGLIIVGIIVLAIAGYFIWKHGANRNAGQAGQVYDNTAQSGSSATGTGTTTGAGGMIVSPPYTGDTTLPPYYYDTTGK